MTIDADIGGMPSQGALDFEGVIIAAFVDNLVFGLERPEPWANPTEI